MHAARPGPASDWQTGKRAAESTVTRAPARTTHRSRGATASSERHGGRVGATLVQLINVEQQDGAEIAQHMKYCLCPLQKKTS